MLSSPRILFLVLWGGVFTAGVHAQGFPSVPSQPPINTNGSLLRGTYSCNLGICGPTIDDGSGGPVPKPKKPSSVNPCFKLGMCPPTPPIEIPGTTFKVPSGLNPCIRGLCGPSTPGEEPVFPVKPNSSNSNNDQVDSASLYSGRRLAVTNACSEKIRLAVSYLNLSNKWVNAGWWTIQTDQTAVLSSNAYGQVRSLNRIFYLYAESLSYTWVGDTTETVGKRTVKMLRIELPKDNDGDWILELTC